MKSKEQLDLAPTVLVGTFRKVNEAWIGEKKLYNLPLPTGYNFEQYQKFTHIVLFSDNNEPIAYSAKFDSVKDKDWLSENGYATTTSPHGSEYIVFRLGRKVRYDEILSDPAADVFVCSSRYTGRIDKDFYTRRCPQIVSGRSAPYAN